MMLRFASGARLRYRGKWRFVVAACRPSDDGPWRVKATDRLAVAVEAYRAHTRPTVEVALFDTWGGTVRRYDVASAAWVAADQAKPLTQ